MVIFTTLLTVVPALCISRRGQSLGMIVMAVTKLNDVGVPPRFWLAYSKPSKVVQGMPEAP
jgi:uncharacterized RDD family membrane protein YckC